MQDKSVLNPSSFKFKPKEEWGRVENNHEAIISKHKRPDGSLRVHTYFTCRICKCNNVKHKNSRAGSLEEQVFEAIKEKYGLENPIKDEKVIDNTKLTRELMEKYIDSVFCEGNEVLNIIWE